MSKAIETSNEDVLCHGFHNQVLLTRLLFAPSSYKCTFLTGNYKKTPFFGKLERSWSNNFIGLSHDLMLHLWPLMCNQSKWCFSNWVLMLGIKVMKKEWLVLTEWKQYCLIGRMLQEAILDMINHSFSKIQMSP